MHRARAQFVVYNLVDNALEEGGVLTPISIGVTAFFAFLTLAFAGQTGYGS